MLIDDQNRALQILRLPRREQDRMVPGLSAHLKNPRLPARRVCRIDQHRTEQFLVNMVGTRAGGEDAAAFKQPHGPQVDLLVPLERLPDLGPAFDECRRIEDDST